MRVDLDPELEARLKLEALRCGRPMAELVREAVRAHLGRVAVDPPPGGGAFRSGHRDTADLPEEALRDLGLPEPPAS
jgi:hypothetical protein